MGKARTNQLHVMLSDEEEAKVRELAARMGYKSTSDFVRNILEAMTDRYGTEGWTSGTLHLEESSILLNPADGETFSTYAFPVVAPNRLWRYLDYLGKKEAPSSGESE